MKTSLRILTAATLLMSAIVLTTACKKDSKSSNNSADNGSAANMSANGATSDNAYDDVSNLAIQTGYDKNLDNLIQKRNGSTTLGYNFCATVTVTNGGNPFPVTVKVDFGAIPGCNGSLDGISRSGSITYVFSGRLSTPLTTVSATFDNYVVNGYHLDGTYSIQNVSTTAFALKTTVTNGQITYPSDSSYSFSGTKTATMVSGDISDPSSLVFNITGNYTVANSNTGESLSAATTTALERKELCAHVDKGIVGFTYTKGNLSAKGTLDYGDGTCDNSALITIGAFTKTVTLP